MGLKSAKIIVLCDHFVKIMTDYVKCSKALILYKLRTKKFLEALNPNPIGGGGAFMAPPVVFFTVHLDRLEFHVQTSWLFSLKSPAYFDI